MGDWGAVEPEATPFKPLSGGSTSEPLCILGGVASRLFSLWAELGGELSDELCEDSSELEASTAVGGGFREVTEGIPTLDGVKSEAAADDVEASTGGCEDSCPEGFEGTKDGDLLPDDVPAEIGWF